MVCRHQQNVVRVVPALANISRHLLSRGVIHNLAIAEAVWRAANDTTGRLRFPAGADAVALAQSEKACEAA